LIVSGKGVACSYR